MIHELTGQHTCELLTGQRVIHVTCSCGWSGEIPIWAWHINEEAKRG